MNDGGDPSFLAGRQTAMSHTQGGHVMRIPGALALLLALMSTSCTTIGAKKLVSSHTAYNDAVQLTVTREVLSNIVRSRYSDPMQFMRVSSINAQFSVSAGGSAGVGGLGAAGAVGDLGGSIGYSDSPTITYVPQSDAGFYKSIFRPFEVEEAIGFGLQYRSARLDPGLQVLALRLAFGSINGANDFVAGKHNVDYIRRVDAIVTLLQIGATYRQIPEWDFDTTSIPREKVTAEDMVDAFQWGINFIEEDGGASLRLARYRLVLALILPNPADSATVAALETLGVKPGRARYVFRAPLDWVPDEEDPYAIRVTPRSMLDVLSLAARVVEVPEAHAAIVPVIEPWPGGPGSESMVQIRSSKERPVHPYRVQHRGYWFYVDDTELESKMFLEALVAAYTSRVGSEEASDDQPQVVLPVGG
jgi:hypothetical protein